MDTTSVTLRRGLTRELEEARERTRYLLSSVSDEDMCAQHSEIMSPLIWDYGHIGNYEELWLLKEAAGRELSEQQLFDIYNAMLTPRSERPSLDMLDRHQADRYLDTVRAAALEALDEADLDGGDPLLRNGFVYRMVLQHEAQHNETMLQTLQLMKGRGYRPEPRRELPSGNPPEQEMVYVPAGTFVMGTDDVPAALDNERPAHQVDLPGFHIDTTPVTNAAFLEFVEDGGYQKKKLWEPEGWAWIRDEDITHPMFWYQKEPHDWWTSRFGFDEPLNPAAPVMHVSFYEADAYARWAGKRLPTEAEWEKAASWDPEKGTGRLFPWGDGPPTPEKANLDQLAFRPAEVGAFPQGASPYGVLGMIGDVWEWTDTEFHGYPGFRSFPYREYSEVFLDDGYMVLRGGSWATRPCAIRNTFRNWDLPIRRQLFAGFRCAS